MADSVGIVLTNNVVDAGGERIAGYVEISTKGTGGRRPVRLMASTLARAVTVLGRPANRVTVGRGSTALFLPEELPSEVAAKDSEGNEVPSDAHQ